MAKTAVVNPRKRRKSSKRRRRNPATTAAANPRRRRRRYYGSARRRPNARRHRRRNPVSPYASGGYRRTPNPLDMKHAFGDIMEIVPAGTLGIAGARFALKASGSWEPDSKGNMQPGIMQAIALFLGAHVSGALVGSVFRSPHKGDVAKIAALSFAGDLFARTRFLANSEFYKQNFSLAGLGDDDDEMVPGEYEDQGLVDGFQAASALGETFEDSQGDMYRSGDRGWALAGMGLDSGPGSGSRLAGMGAGGQLALGPDGTVYQLSGFQQSSALGANPARSNTSSSFGYSP